MPRHKKQPRKRPELEEMAFQFVRYEHYARLYTRGTGRFLVVWDAPGNRGKRKFRSPARAMETYTRYEKRIDKYYGKTRW